MKSIFALILLPLTCFGVPSIAVTISVYQPFVQQLIGEQAHVFSIIPTATNMHIYEPSPEQLQKIAQALVWFSTADPLEAHIRRSITTPHIV